MLDETLDGGGRSEQRAGGVGQTPAAIDPEERSRAAYLLANLRGRGFAVEGVDGKLTVTPGSRLTDGDGVEIREYKLLLLDLLTNEPRCLPKSDWTAGDREMVRLAGVGAFRWWYDGITERRWWSPEREDGHGEGEDSRS